MLEVIFYYSDACVPPEVLDQVSVQHEDIKYYLCCYGESQGLKAVIALNLLCSLAFGGLCCERSNVCMN